jgi:hypothetical protein
MSSDESKAPGKQRHRSPNYPLFDLQKAMERTQQLYDRDKTHKVPVTVLHDRWGYKAMSGALKQAIGALKSYGLIVVEGEGVNRFVAVSDRGRRILLDAPDKPQLLKDAAVTPSLFSSLWARYGITGIPSDDVLRHHLIFDLNFNDESVGDAIARFKSTIAFAKLSSSDKMAVGGREEDDGFDPADNGADAGRETPLREPRKESRRMNSPSAKEFVYPLDEGPAVLTFPGDLSADSVEELEEWLGLVLKKFKRRKPQASAEPDDDQDE